MLCAMNSDELNQVARMSIFPNLYPNGLFPCGLCGEVLHSYAALDSHLTAHKQKLEQDITKTTTRPVDEDEDEDESTGVGVGQYPCDRCDKTFSVPARLTRHYRVHTGEKPFACDFCPKSFSVKENLSVHRRIHTNERPYTCDICGRAFEHSGKLHRHVRIHTGERPHKCEICGKTFIQSGQLVIHRRTHTGEKPYECQVCSKGFTCSKQLKVHMRTHTGEKPYKCNICNKSFGYNHVLKLHQVSHFGEKVYKCTLCKETFTSKKSMENHIRNHSDADMLNTGAPRSSTKPSSSVPSSPYQPSTNAPTTLPHPTTSQPIRFVPRANSSTSADSGFASSSFDIDSDGSDGREGASPHANMESSSNNNIYVKRARSEYQNNAVAMPLDMRSYDIQQRRPETSYRRDVPVKSDAGPISCVPLEKLKAQYHQQQTMRNDAFARPHNIPLEPRHHQPAQVPHQYAQRLPPPYSALRRESTDFDVSSQYRSNTIDHTKMSLIDSPLMYKMMLDRKRKEESLDLTSPLKTPTVDLSINPFEESAPKQQQQKQLLPPPAATISEEEKPKRSSIFDRPEFARVLTKQPSSPEILQHMIKQCLQRADTAIAHTARSPSSSPDVAEVVRTISSLVDRPDSAGSQSSSVKSASPSPSSSLGETTNTIAHPLPPRKRKYVPS